MPPIQGADRHTVIQFPPTLDDTIAADNPQFMKQRIHTWNIHLGL